MTSDGDALFRAICEQPWENTPRLVYADWLEENGRPERAEFIRTQITLADDLEPHRAIELAARADQLLQRSGGSWALRALACVELGPFRRGFPGTARFDGPGAFAAHADAVFARAPIDTLVVTDLNDGDVRELVKSQYLTRLRALELRGTGVRFTIGDEGCEELARCPHLANLVYLELWANGVTDAGALVLAESAPLKSVQRFRLGGQPRLTVETRRRMHDRFDPFVG